MKTKNFLWFLLTIPVLLLSGCEKEEAAKSQSFDLTRPGAKIGVPAGAAAMTVGEKTYPKAKHIYFNSLAEGYLAVQTGKIDAFIFDRHCMEYVARTNPSLTLLKEDIAEEKIVVGFAKKHSALRNEVNAFIKQYRADGTYKDMYKRWIGTATLSAIPKLPRPEKPSRKFIVGTEGLNVPMSFIDSQGKLSGFDLEFIQRLAVYLNAELEVKDMTYTALLSSLETGKIDMLISSLNATPEREERVLFSDCYIDSGITAIIHADHAQGKTSITSLKDLHGKKVASLTGSAFCEMAEKVAPEVKTVNLFFNDNALSVQALLNGKVDAVFLDEPMNQLWCAYYPDELYLAATYANDAYSFAIKKNSPLTAKINKIIEDLEKSGELDKFKTKWCKSVDKNRTVTAWTHKKDYNGSAGVLRYATDPTQEPMAFMLNGKYAGMDIEVINRIAYELNMKLEITSLNFGALLDTLQAGKADLVGGSMSITPARLEKVDFVKSFYKGGYTILAKKAKEKNTGIQKITDLAGKNVGVNVAGTLSTLAEKFVSNVKYVYFSDNHSAVQALLTNKIDAVLLDEPVAGNFVSKTPDRLQIASIFVEDNYGFALSKQSPLKERASAVVRKMEADGELAELKKKWCGSDQSKKKLTDWKKKFKFTGKNGKLRFSAPPYYEPLCYIGPDGTAIGYEIDVINRIAAELDMELEFISIVAAARIETIVSKRADISGGSMSITKERMEKVDFLPSHYKGGVAILTGRKTENKPSVSVKKAVKDFAKDLQASFERTFLRENRWKLVLDGLKITVVITLLATVFGTLLAFPVWILRSARNKFLQGCGKVFIAIMQGTPILVVLMVLYYLIFAKVDINAVLIAILGFSLNFAAYAGEMLRTGIEAVPKGQREAALALGFPRWQTFYKVVLPQALRQILPVYRGEFINMLKSTSIVGYIAIQDLTKVSDIIRSRTYEAFFPLLSTALIYFVTAWILSRFLVWLDFRLDPAKRRDKLTKEATK